MCLFSTQIKACAHTFSKHRHHPPALLPSFLPPSRTSLFFPSSSNHQSWKPIAKLRKPHQLTPPTHTPTKLSTLDPFWLKKSLARQAAEQWIRHERFSHPLSHAFSSLRRPLHPAGTDRFLQTLPLPMRWDCRLDCGTSSFGAGRGNGRAWLLVWWR